MPHLHGSVAAERSRSAARGERREPVARCSVKFDAHLIFWTRTPPEAPSGWNTHGSRPALPAPAPREPDTRSGRDAEASLLTVTVILDPACAGSAPLLRQLAQARARLPDVRVDAWLARTGGSGRRARPKGGRAPGTRGTSRPGSGSRRGRISGHASWASGSRRIRCSRRGSSPRR
jgi:hypothetical protein